MRLAASYVGYYGKSFEEFLLELDTRNLCGVQLIPDQTPNLYSEITPEREKYLAQILKERNLTCHLHNVFYDINIVSLVPAVQDLALRISEKVFAIARSLGAHTVTVHPGYMFPGWRADKQQSSNFWKAAEKGLCALAQISARYGVRALIENGSYHITTASRASPRPLHVGIEPVEVRKLLDFTNNGVGLSLDFNKALDSGMPISEFICLVGSSIEQVQVSDVSNYTDQWCETARFLQRCNPDCWLVLEGPIAARHKDISAIRSLSDNYRP